MRELATQIAFPSWPGVTSVSALKRAAQEAEITARVTVQLPLVEG